MRADNAEAVRRNAEREQQRKEQEKQDAIAEEAAEKILDKTDIYLEAKKYDEVIQLANKAIRVNVNEWKKEQEKGKIRASAGNPLPRNAKKPSRKMKKRLIVAFVYGILTLRPKRKVKQ